uniref:Major facilitator superfamily (MFS) profile domain-containing protein n=1 Tax=Aegilops tauschii subsp. strangulata TaxID=200361 RepID=A0A453Q8J3_AEGTS
MRGAALVALAAALGNMLQGWDNATIAGSLLYIKRDFGLHGQPALQGLLVATSLIGATLITTFSGPLSDRVGRRPMLVASSLLYTLAGLLMLWSPTVGVLLLARLVDGFAVGLAVTLVPVYISETAPPEVRGLLSTLPQLTGSTGMFLSYCMVFAMTLAPSPNWRVMMGVLVLPSLVYVAVTVFFLPESPRWLVSKGRMKEARVVLRMLRGREDVDGEMALLAEGLGAGGETAIEEYIVGPAPEDDGGDQHALHGHVAAGQLARQHRRAVADGQHARPPAGPRSRAPRRPSRHEARRRRQRQHAFHQLWQHAQRPRRHGLGRGERRAQR